MRLRKEPVKPTRRRFTMRKDVFDFETPKEILDWLNDLPVPLEDISINEENSYDWRDLYFIWEEHEQDDAYNKRLAAYEKKLYEYNQWYNDNKTDIEKMLADKAVIEAQKKQREINKLKSKLKKLEQAL